QHGGEKATLHPRADGAVEIAFDGPVRALAPGQAAVFYDGDEVLGGGWIRGPLP
nr:tRNA 2-thiouridine(34) synthase MnmA [Myxococcota bacterium]